MKIAIILILTAFVGFAQDSIQVKDPVTVMKGGELLGKPFDAAANNPAMASDLQVAMENWWKEHQAVSAQALAIALTEAEAKHSEALRKLSDEFAIEKAQIVERTDAAIAQAVETARAAEAEKQKAIESAKAELDRIRQAVKDGEAGLIAKATAEKNQLIGQAQAAEAKAGEAQSDKAAAEAKLAALIAAVELGNPAVLEVELEAAKRSRAEDQKRELQRIREQLDRAESELQTP